MSIFKEKYGYEESLVKFKGIWEFFSANLGIIIL